MNNYFNLGSVKPLYYFFGVSAFLGVVFAFVSNNEQSNFLVHLALWLLQAMGPILLLVYAHIALHASRTFDRMNPWVKLIISGLLGAILFSPIALFLDFLWNNDRFPKDISTLFFMWIDELSGVVPPITASWVAINAPWVLGYRFTAAPREEDKNERASAVEKAQSSENNKNSHPESLSPNLYSYFDPNELGEIIFLKAELHYLLVVGTKKKQLILYNLKDAINDLPANMGLKAHRSFWVNRAHITKVVKNGREAKALMSNSVEIPISRSQAPLFKAFL